MTTAFPKATLLSLLKFADGMAGLLAKMFGSGKKGEPPSPQQAIQKLRETEEMLSKKSEFLEKRIDREMQTAKKNGMKNKRGECGMIFAHPKELSVFV